MSHRASLPRPHPIKALLAVRRITNADLASEVGCNPGTLGRVLNGYVAPWPALRERCAIYPDVLETELFREPFETLQ